MWLPLMRPLLGTWPITQVFVLTGNRTCDPLLCSPVLNPLSYASQGCLLSIFTLKHKCSRSAEHD